MGEVGQSEETGVCQRGLVQQFHEGHMGRRAGVLKHHADVLGWGRVPGFIDG